MNWKSKLLTLNGMSDPPGRYQLRQHLFTPATEEVIASAEDVLNTRFPFTLRSLLLESDGVMQMMAVKEGEWFDESWTVWSVHEIVEQNRWHREHYADRRLSRFLFFSSAGTDGIMFGFPAADEPQPDLDVYAWYPDETDDKLLSNGLEQFLTGWRHGDICV